MIMSRVVLDRMVLNVMFRHAQCWCVPVYFAMHSVRSASQTTVDPDEVRRFQSLASKWWDEQGEFAALHAMNDLRVPFIRWVFLHNMHFSIHYMFEMPRCHAQVTINTGEWLAEASSNCVKTWPGGDSALWYLSLENTWGMRWSNTLKVTVVLHTSTHFQPIAFQLPGTTYMHVLGAVAVWIDKICCRDPTIITLPIQPGSRCSSPLPPLWPCWW